METRIISQQERLKQEIPSSSGWEILCKNPEVISQLPENTTLTIGFGVSPILTPRILSYPLLGLEMLRDKPAMKLEMYVATQFASLQGVTPEQSEYFALQLRQVVGAFVNEFYGDIADRVSFVETQPITPERIEIINKLSPLLKNDQEVMKFVMRKAQTDDKIEQALAYIASHSLYMRDPLPIDSNLFFVQPPDDGSTVAMIGGPAEEIMWQARQTILNELNCSENIPPQLFTTIGRMPPYYRKQNEPTLNESEIENTVPQAMLQDGDLFRDYAYLTVAIARSLGKNVPFQPLRAKEKDRQQFLDQDYIWDSLNTLQQFCNQFANNT